jgi:adiponectin receptor
MKSTPFITAGYRQDYTAARAITSMFECHNETSSIWSHFIPSLGFAAITFANLVGFMDGESVANDTLHEVLIVLYSFASTLLCVCSTVFHVMCCVSEDVYRLTARIDYTGIVVMIVVSFWPFMYQIFYCEPIWALFYSFAITLIGVVVLIVSWTPALNVPEYTHLRALLFLGMGAFAVFPVPHAIGLVGWGNLWPVFWPLSLMGALYSVGALLYGYQVPERFFPGHHWFNRGIFTSHFLFHVFSVAAACVHYWNAHNVLIWRATTLVC